MNAPHRLLAVGAVALSLAACSHNRSGPAYAPPAANAAATVTLTSGLRFDPKEISIKAGQTVEWRNKSVETHTVTGMGFDSGDLKPGTTFSHTFTAPGRYDYVCKPHHSLGMTGTVVVS
jgi:plastocyanin